MSEAAAASPAGTRSTRGRARGSRARPVKRPVRMPRWRRVLRASLVASVLAALAVPVIGWLREPPRIEPPFERIVGEGAGPVKELGLKDLQGRTHTAADWAGRPAVVLFVLAPDCPGSRQAAPEMARLARDFAPRGIVFFGVCPAPRETAEAVAARASEWALPFPILLDPAQQVIRQAGVRVTPEAVVLLPDGQVLYRGRVDDRSASEGPRRPAPRPRRSDLEAALVAILAEEMPVVTQTRAFGT